MKKIISLIVVLMISTTTFVLAQQTMEDVVYLHNGTVYRGIIIEQTPGVSLKIETNGGNIYFIESSQIAKISTENLVDMRPAKKIGKAKTPRVDKAIAPRDTSAYKPKTKGYFFQGQILIEALQGGIHIINGYKFGRFGYFGIGVGFDNVIISPTTIIDEWDSNQGFEPGSYSNNYSGVYLPIYLYHQGDILNKKVTPFYAVEVGYAMAFNKSSGLFNRNNNNGVREGGVMAGAGIGIRFNSKKRRTHFSLLLNVNMKNVRYEENIYAFDEVTGDYLYSNNIIHKNLFFPGIRFGIGF